MVILFFLNEGIFDRFKKKKQDDGKNKEEKYIKEMEDLINKVIEKYPFKEGFDDQDKDVFFMACLYIDENKIIKDFIKNKSPEAAIDEIYGSDIEDSDNSKIKSMVKEPFFTILDGASYFYLIHAKTKKFYYLSVDDDEFYELNSISKNHNHMGEYFYEDLIKYVIEADKNLGYYKLSKAPNGVKPKEFPIK